MVLIIDLDLTPLDFLWGWFKTDVYKSIRKALIIRHINNTANNVKETHEVIGSAAGAI